MLICSSCAQAFAPEAATQAMRLLSCEGQTVEFVESSPATSFDERCPGQSQELNDAALAAKSFFFQYARSTRAGCECISHALQALSELGPNATILSTDGIAALDQMSRGAMLQGLAALQFVRWCDGSPWHYILEDDEGVVHDVAQGKGGKHGDPMMPLLFAGLPAIQRKLSNHDKVFAFLDDVDVLTSTDRTLAEYTTLQSELL